MEMEEGRRLRTDSKGRRERRWWGWRRRWWRWGRRRRRGWRWCFRWLRWSGSAERERQIAIAGITGAVGARRSQIRWLWYGEGDPDGQRGVSYWRGTYGDRGGSDRGW